ncbi:putative reverse transcriptase domain-containing protein [Tanacetum coccineum]
MSMVEPRTDADTLRPFRQPEDAMLPTAFASRFANSTTLVLQYPLLDAENWISHMEKIFDVRDGKDSLRTRLLSFKELFFLQFFPRAEQERLKREYHSIRQRASENSTEYMQRFLRLAVYGVAQVADACTNLEILRDRDDYDRCQNVQQELETRNQSATHQKVTGSYQKKRPQVKSLIVIDSNLLYDMNTNITSGNRILVIGRDQRQQRVSNPTALPTRVPNSPGYPLRAGHLQAGTARTTQCYSSDMLTRAQTHTGCVFALTQDQPPILSVNPQPMKDSHLITQYIEIILYSLMTRFVQLMHFPGMCEFDIILGIDWLAAHRATIDCHSRRVIFGDIHAPEFIYHGSLPGKPMKIISALKARTLLSHGCEGFLATIHDTTSDVSSIHDQPIVSEFQDVFPEELLGIPPIRDDQLQELLERGFIRPSVSPWGAPVLFHKKKDGSMRLLLRSGFGSLQLQPLEIPMWKWDEISMDFVTGLPTTQKRHDAILVVVDRVISTAHSYLYGRTMGISKLARIFFDRKSLCKTAWYTTSIVSTGSVSLVSFGKLQNNWGLVLSSVQHFILKPKWSVRGGHSDVGDMLRALCFGMDGVEG